MNRYINLRILIILVILTISGLSILTGCNTVTENELYSDERVKEESQETESSSESETIKRTGKINNEILVDLIKVDDDDIEINAENILSEDTELVGDFIVPGRNIRPYAVMIDNQGTRVLPQGGLDKAQIVYEIVVEFGITRLMPIFWGTESSMIGPVRSSRHYFLDYAYEYDSIYINYGWSPFAANDLIHKKLTYINGMTNAVKMFWDITNDTNDWQDTYTSTKKIYENIERLGYAKTTEYEFPFKYNEEFIQESNGVVANNIKINYSKSYTCGYKYDNEKKEYLRIRDDKSHLERVSNKQISTVNIIIMKVENHTIEGDKEGRQDLKTIGDGTGYYISMGKAVKITWQKEGRFTKTNYYLENGERLNLNIGQTWIQIVPIQSEVEIN